MSLKGGHKSRILSGERVVTSLHGVGKTEYPHAKE